jgi:hypothetical protein
MAFLIYHPMTEDRRSRKGKGKGGGQICPFIRNSLSVGHRWLKPVILANQEVEIGGLQFKANLGK